MSGFRTGSNKNGQFWFGVKSFPDFLYKKNVGSEIPGGSTVSNKPNEFWNKYTPGSGVGSSNIAARRAKMIKATTCDLGQN